MKYIVFEGTREKNPENPGQNELEGKFKLTETFSYVT